MAWLLRLTELSGQSLYVNIDQVVSVEPLQWEKGEGARVRTTLVKDGGPVDFSVQESPDKVYDKVLASR
ncbi:MAG: hypothetical protein QOD74_130 [Variibacter sp.]|jgi:hypothetical protein|nr:hypothetical protein [Variibacter sp.]